jgi:hypothetical protein
MTGEPLTAVEMLALLAEGRQSGWTAREIGRLLGRLPRPEQERFVAAATLLERMASDPVQRTMVAALGAVMRLTIEGRNPAHALVAVGDLFPGVFEGDAN